MRPHIALTLSATLLAGAARAEDPPAETPEVKLTPVMQLQVWGTAMDMDEDPQADPASYGDPEADLGFSVRRTRLGLGGERERLSWLLSVGTSAPYDALFAASSRVDIVDAWGAYTWGEDSTFALTLGSAQVPFTREMLMSTRHMLFQDRSVSTTWLSPNRDVGLVGDWAHGSGLRVRASVTNGSSNGRGNGTSGGSLLGDDNLGVEVAGRVEYASGDAYRTFGDENAVGIAISGLYNADVATNALGLNADALVRVGPITAMVGAMRLSLSPVDDPVALPQVPVDTVRWGTYAQLSGNLAQVGEGALELGARYASFDDATALQDNGDVSIVDAGLTWRDPVPGLDVGAAYVLRLEHHGRSLPNDTVRLFAQIRYPFNDR